MLKYVVVYFYNFFQLVFTDPAYLFDEESYQQVFGQKTNNLKQLQMCERCGNSDCSPETPFEQCKWYANIKQCVASLHTGIKCPHCEKLQLFAGDYRGQLITCPICDNGIQIY